MCIDATLGKSVKAENDLSYLRAESVAAAVDDALEGLVAAVGEDVSLQPSPRAGRAPVDLAALPVADEVVAASLCAYVRRLCGKINESIKIFVSC